MVQEVHGPVRAGASCTMKLPASALLAAGLCLGPSHLQGQLTFDANTGLADVQNGGGTWNQSLTNWWNGSSNVAWDNSGSTVAAFGSSSSKTGGTVTVEGTVKLGGMRFNPFSTATVADLPVTSAYTITGGTLQFADNAIIEAANNSSSGSGTVLFINLNSTLVGNGLTLQRTADERINAFQYMRFQASNPNLTGTLNVNARSSSNGMFLLLASSSNVSAMERLVVQSGSVLATGGTGNVYAMPISIAGNGQGNGAIRFDGNNIRFTAPITVTEDAAVMTNRSITNIFIDGPIMDSGSTVAGFQRFSSSANSVVTLGGTSTYRGATSIGRAGSSAGGTTLLNFAAAGAPAADMLYNAVATPGALNMAGGVSGNATFVLQGKDETRNTQRFGDLVVAGTRSNLILTSGAAGSMNISVGNISRTSPASITFTTDAPGAISTTTADGFLGPWAALVNRTGNGSWAGVSGGKLTSFLGSTAHASGTPLSSYGSAADVRIDSSSTGTISGGSGTFQVNTLSMTDSTSPRTVDIGAGNVLRLGATGGIQITRGAQSLDIGVPGSAGALRSGTGTGQIWISNLSDQAVLTVNSVLENNGSSALSVYFNGTGKTVLTGANTYTGVTQIGSGVVEIRHASALGTAGGNTTVLANGTLRLSGSISLAEPLVINGMGAGNSGALINTSGSNEITAAVTVSQPARITSEAGTLTFKAASGSTDIIAASATGTPTIFGGNGDILIQGRLNAGSNTVTKEGAGTLTFAGANVFTGALLPTAGTVHLDFSSAASPATNILYSGVATPVALSLNSSNLRLTGQTAATNAQTFGALTITNLTGIQLNSNGATNLTATFGTVTRAFGALLALDISPGSNLLLNTGTNNTLLTANGRPFAFIRDSINGDEWAATGTLAGGTRPVVKLSSLSGAAGYSPSTLNGLTGNADIAAGVGTTTLTANASVDSLRFAQPQNTLIGESATGTTLTAGGILVSSTVGAHTSTITLGTLRATPTATSTNPELNIIQNNTAAPLVINAAISNSLNASNAAATVSVNKAGPGLLVLNGAHTFSGNFRVFEGAVQFTGGSLNSGMEFLLGSGASSGKVILGEGSTAFSPTIDYIQTVGTGTENRIVGGASTLSRLVLTGASSTFSSGFLGGPGMNENNLELRYAALDGLVTLGAANTYAGRTILSRGTLQVEKLANTGEASSLGTGNFDASAATIVMGDATTGALNSHATAVLKYVGSTDSVTNRPLLLTNADLATDIASVSAVLENIGTGTLKFTAPFQVGGSNPVDRVLKLTGTNTGLNEVVGIGDVSAGILTRLEKDGPGTWALTGNSTFSGGTTLTRGTLLANNPVTGSATGLGPVQANAGTVLGGTGRIAPAAGNSIVLSGATLNPGLPGIGNNAGTLILETSGSGQLQMTGSSKMLLDLVLGAGMGSNIQDATAADLLMIRGMLDLQEGSVLQVGNPNALTAWAANDQWKLFDWSGLTAPVTGTFGSYDLPALPEGLVWNIDELFTTGILSISLVPEPGRLGLFGLALAGLAGRRRRA